MDSQKSDKAYPEQWTDRGVWLPLPLAQALFLCYYGDGPRHAQRNEPRPVQPRNAQEAPAQVPATPPNEEGILTVVPSLRLRPRGIAARQEIPPEKKVSP